MPRATCRCGQKLTLPVNGPDRVICPKCSAKIRVRQDAPKVGPGDGFIRFHCPCGRRLKVRADENTPTASLAGKCPDCGRIVPVPTQTGSHSGPLKVKGHSAETPTEELGPEDFTRLESWAASHLARAAAAAMPPPAHNATPTMPPAVAPATVKAEAGLRVCPRCGRPIRLSAVACRECGAPVPKR